MFVIESKVIHGRGKGKLMGFATINQDTSMLKQMPEIGVYASKIYYQDKMYVGVTNVGTRPTVDNDKDVTIETHILDFDKDIYDQIIRTELCFYLRGIKKFGCPEELLKQIENDGIKAKELILENKA